MDRQLRLLKTRINLQRMLLLRKAERHGIRDFKVLKQSKRLDVLILRYQKEFKNN